MYGATSALPRRVDQKLAAPIPYPRSFVSQRRGLKVRAHKGRYSLFIRTQGQCLVTSSSGTMATETTDTGKTSAASKEELHPLGGDSK